VFKTCYLTARRFAPEPALAWIDRIENSPLGSRLVLGVFWSAIGAVVSRSLALVAGIVIARLIGKAAFGEYGVIQSTLSMFSAFAMFGVGLTATKHIAEFRRADPERTGRIVGMSYGLALLSGLAVGLLMLVAAPLVAEKCLAAPHLAGMVAISSISLVFLVLSEAQVAILSGLEAFRRRSLLQVYGGIAGFPISVIGVYFFGLTGAVGALAVSLGVMALLNSQGIGKESALAAIPIRWTGFHKEMGLVWRFNVPTLLCSSVYVPSMWLANLFLVNAPNGYAQMGLFTAADRWRTAIGFLPSLLGGVALPMLSTMSGEPDSHRFAKLLRANVAISCLISSTVALPVAALAPWIMRSYGADFTDGRWVLVILCATAVTHAAYWIIGQSLVSKGRVWTIFRMNLGWAVLLVGTTWFLRGHGALGLATAYLAADAFRLGAGFLVTRCWLRQSSLSAVPDDAESRR